jgi:uncharacterized protein (DUF1697 family)
MPERCIALLRGINVGKAKRISMADLRALVEELGYHDVRTLLNSGNVVFTAARSAPAGAGARIEEALAARLGVSVRVTVLTAPELGIVMDENPLLGIAADPSRLLVAVLATPADRARAEPLLDESWDPEVLALGSRAAYLWCPGGIAAGRLAEAVDRRLRGGVTARNWATMTKLRQAASG